MIGRGEHAEIITFVGKTVDSELSGNVIDLCPGRRAHFQAVPLHRAPVGADAPAFGEPALRPRLEPDVQMKQNRVMRVLPRENEAINECWLSDKDRFSYEGLNSEQRLAAADAEARRRVEGGRVAGRARLRRARAEAHPRASTARRAIGALATPHQTLEELFLLRKARARARLGQRRFPPAPVAISAPTAGVPGAPWLGMKIAELGKLDRVLVIGSTLAQGPSAASRTACARRREARSAVEPHQSVRRRPADARRAQGDRRPVGDGATCWRRWRRPRPRRRTPRCPTPARERDAVSGRRAARSPRASPRARTPAIFLGNLAQHHPAGRAAARAGAGARRG